MTREEMIHVLKDVDARLDPLEAATIPASCSSKDPNYPFNHCIYNARAIIGIAWRILENEPAAAQPTQEGN